MPRGFRMRAAGCGSGIQAVSSGSWNLLGCGSGTIIGFVKRL